MKTLSSQYAQFTPEERLRLTIAADERGDNAEVERLMRSCPQFAVGRPIDKRSSAASGSLKFAEPNRVAVRDE